MEAKRTYFDGDGTPVFIPEEIVGRLNDMGSIENQTWWLHQFALDISRRTALAHIRIHRLWMAVSLLLVAVVFLAVMLCVVMTKL